MQFLMGLNESFSIIKGQILSMDPFPSVTKVFALVVQEEKHKEVGASTSGTSASEVSHAFAFLLLIVVIVVCWVILRIVASSCMVILQIIRGLIFPQKQRNILLLLHHHTRLLNKYLLICLTHHLPLVTRVPNFNLMPNNIAN